MPVQTSNGYQVFSAYEVRDLCKSVGFPAAAAETMGAIAMRESQGYTGAHNPKPPDDSYGLFQINLLAHVSRWPSYDAAVKCCTDPSCSAQFALGLYRASSFQPWTTYTNNTLGPYLDASGKLKSGLPDAAGQFARAVSSGFIPSGVTMAGGNTPSPVPGPSPDGGPRAPDGSGPTDPEGTATSDMGTQVRDAVIAGSVLAIGIILFAIGANGVAHDNVGTVGKALKPLQQAQKTVEGATSAGARIAAKAAMG